jgi:hypothetical protein
MSWLSRLEEYAAKYADQLRMNRFFRVASKDGNGMGAFIGYANRMFDLDLENDRGDFIIWFLNASWFSRIKAGFLFRSKAHFFSKRVSFNVILALAAAAKNGKDFSELSADEKPEYWQITYSPDDPLAAFFANLKDINELLKRTKSTKLKTWIDSYGKGLVEWRYGPTAVERTLTQEERDRFPPTMFQR